MRVRFFARARDLTGVDVIDVELPEMPVRDLREYLVGRFPKLAGFVQHCAVAVNDEYAEESQRVPPDAEVALLPPVSGG